jgi:hypothetical protein
MRVLFDHGTPSGIAGSLSGHEVTEAIERGWDRISNGELLNVAEAAGFNVLLATDKRIRYQQNFTGQKLAVVVLGNSTWRVVRLYLDRIVLAVNEATPGSYAEVHTVQVKAPVRFTKGPLCNELRSRFALGFPRHRLGLLERISDVPET